MKKTFVFYVLAVLLIQNISAQQLGDLYTEKDAGFTMSMPRGWQAVDLNQKYLMITGPLDGQLTPNIGFVDEVYSGPLSFYIDSALSLMPTIFSDFELLDRMNFTTNSGVDGESITYHVSFGNVQMRQKMYVYPNRDGTSLLIISCTAPFENGSRYDLIFDASVKTFNWIR